MTISKIDFIKGHMGGNEIMLLYGDQIPAGMELAAGVSALKAPSLRGDNAGILYKGDETDLSVKIIDFTMEDYISGCGGLTQVLGKALVDTNLAARFNIGLQPPLTRIQLKTDGGIIPIDILIENNNVQEIRSHMQTYIDECYELGVTPMEMAGINGMRVGNYLVLNTAEIRKHYPHVDCEQLDNELKQVVVQAQKDFDCQLNQELSDYVALYDLESRQHDGRLLFPHNIGSGQIEPSCGTGTLAVGVAMLERGELTGQGDIELSFECGGDTVHMGGPDLTGLHIQMESGAIKNIMLTHSRVEILAEGRLWMQS